MATIEPYKLCKPICPDDCTKREHQRYMVRYRKPDGKQTKKRGFRRKTDAEQFESTVEVEKLEGAYIAPSLGKAKLEDFWPAWYAGQLDLKESWRVRVESIWRVHLQPKWGHRQVASIERHEIQEWVGTLNRAASTIHDIVCVLGQLFDAVVDRKNLRANPARRLNLPKIDSKPEGDASDDDEWHDDNEIDHYILTANQVRLLTSLAKHPEIVWLLASVGLRWGEMAALRPCDLNFATNRVRVRRSASKVNGRIVMGPVKTWEARTVVVAAEIMAMLKPPCEGKQRTALLWERERKGGPLRPPTTTHWFTRAVIKAQAADPTFPDHLNAHRLRHTAASLMIQQRQNIKKVQLQLGHKTAQMTTDRYGHLYGDDLDEIGFAMSAALGFTAENGAQSVPTGLQAVPDVA